MTAPIAAIGGFSPIAQVAPLGSAGTGAASGSGNSFGAMLADSLKNVQSLQNKADDLAVQSATGSLTDVHDYMIASTEAQLATQLTVAVRNKAVDAFNEIMRMQA
jgi:flagellar hook-basal body complex protein FliE